MKRYILVTTIISFPSVSSQVLGCRIINAADGVVQFTVTGMSRQSMMKAMTPRTIEDSNVGNHQTPTTRLSNYYLLIKKTIFKVLLKQ